MTGRLAVLGGCGGIGRVLVAEALTAGYTPIVLDLPVSIERHPLDVETLPVDASSASDMARAARSLPLDLAGFVNLCGFMSEAQPVAETSPDIWETVLTGNLTAAYHAAQAIVPRMSAGGAIVLIGSGLGHLARPGYGPYAISKAGIAALIRQLALELAPAVRVNCVAPSAVDTAFLRGGTGKSDETAALRLDLDAYAQVIPLQRIATAEDVTGPVLFLLSDQARYITGQVLHVNGGTFMP